MLKDGESDKADGGLSSQSEAENEHDGCEIVSDVSHRAVYNWNVKDETLLNGN